MLDNERLQLTIDQIQARMDNQAKLHDEVTSLEVKKVDLRCEHHVDNIKEANADLLVERESLRSKVASLA